MVFDVSSIDFINILIISGGIGVCTMCVLYITASVHMDKMVRRYFQIFFGLIIFYVANHLVRQTLDGIQGNAVRTTLYAVTFAEVLSAGFMSHMISVRVLFVSKAEKPKKMIMNLLNVLLLIHLILLIANIFGEFVFYFDAGNHYFRGAGYILSNLCPLAMLLIDIVLLIRYAENYDHRVRSAFWFYMIAPIAAIVIQSIFYGIQFIMLATVVAAVYMFSVVNLVQNERYNKQKMESSRIETELSLATKIQKNMLPSLFPAFPEREEFGLFASMTPALEVGGDFYDFFLVDDDHLALVVADVSGKGVPAAMFMMFSKNIIANNVMLGKSPAQALSDANSFICTNNSENMFVTVWLGVLEISSGRLTYADAGHEKMVIYQNGDWRFAEKTYSGIALGMFDNDYLEMLPKKRQIVNQEVLLKPGDAIFQYTDGVTEATDHEKELFGEERLLKACVDSPDADPNQLLPFIRSKIDEFVKDAPQFDDITMLGVCYKGTADSDQRSKQQK